MKEQLSEIELQEYLSKMGKTYNQSEIEIKEYLSETENQELLELEKALYETSPLRDGDYDRVAHENAWSAFSGFTDKMRKVVMWRKGENTKRARIIRPSHAGLSYDVHGWSGDNPPHFGLDTLVDDMDIDKINFTKQHAIDIRYAIAEWKEANPEK
ncbi:MAG: hypothetical protein FWE31_02425 [Firmicutes bacterium]|nr:hypothetical protein [Bacillota bacterium]